MTRTESDLSPAYTRRRRIWFWAALTALNLSVLVLAVGLYRHVKSRPQGRNLNSLAWRACYDERGQAVPSGGPREGYWGRRLWPHTEKRPFGALAVGVDLSGLVIADAEGFQRAPDRFPGALRLLILGGSVAAGAYASRADTAYFSLLQRQLADQGIPVNISVLAGGGWTSDNEVGAMAAALEKHDFDAVLFLDGLNDLTEKKNVSMPRRTEQYLSHLETATRQLAEQGVLAIVALQPFLPEKKKKSALEKRILSLYPVVSSLGEAWVRLRAGLATLSEREGAAFIDCADALGDETVTTFTDLWHFADPGHRLLARCLADGLAPTLQGRQPKNP